MDAGYLAARAAHDHHDHGWLMQVRNWRLMALASCSVTVMSLILVALFFAAGRHRIVPYVIGVDQLGNPVFAGLATATGSADPRLLKGAMYEWIDKWRMVSSDAAVQKEAIIGTVFSRIAEGSQARAAIDAWYRASPPSARLRDGTVTVDVRSILPSGKNVEVDWIERTWKDGAMVKEEHYRGSFGLVLQPPSDEKTATLNPLGLYVTEASWTKLL